MRKKCIKFLTFFIISLLSCVLFSADTKAITFTKELEPTGVEWTNPDSQCYYGGTGQGWRTSTGTDTKWSCNNPPSGSSWDGDINSIRTIDNYPIVEGNYYQLMLVLRNNSTSASQVNPIYWNFYNSEHFTNVGLEIYYEGDRGELENCSYYYNGSNLQSSICQSGLQLYNAIVLFTVRANDSGNFKIQVGDTNGVLLRGNYPGASVQYVYTFGLKKVTEFTSGGSAAMNEKDDEDRDNIESQQESSSSDSESSAEDATAQGTTLLGAFSAFVSALGNATPSDCTLDMDLGNLDMGEVDFCELDPPAGFSALASIFLILFCVPLSIATARKVINLFRSFQ